MHAARSTSGKGSVNEHAVICIELAEHVQAGSLPLARVIALQRLHPNGAQTHGDRGSIDIFRHIPRPTREVKSPFREARLRQRAPWATRFPAVCAVRGPLRKSRMECIYSSEGQVSLTLAWVAAVPLLSLAQAHWLGQRRGRDIGEPLRRRVRQRGQRGGLGLRGVGRVLSALVSTGPCVSACDRERDGRLLVFLVALHFVTPDFCLSEPGQRLPLQVDDAHTRGNVDGFLGQHGLAPWRAGARWGRLAVEQELKNSGSTLGHPPVRCGWAPTAWSGRRSGGHRWSPSLRRRSAASGEVEAMAAETRGTFTPK